MERRPKVLMILPTGRDMRNLASESIRSRYEVNFFGKDVENPGDLDVDRFLSRLRAHLRKHGVPDGLVGDDDYPANLVAGLITRDLKLPGPSLEALFLCQHKFYSREAQKASVPEAVPPYERIALDSRPHPRLPFPLFVKPVKGYLSILSRKISSEAQLATLIREARAKIPYFIGPFDRVLKLAGLKERFPHGGRNLIAEGLLTGLQVTLEGYVSRSRVHLIDIVDSHFYPGTGSFSRFETPSRLPAPVQARMFRAAEKFLKSIGFNDSLFNVEFLYEPRTGAVKILEVNSRMASQFAEMTEAAHGTNTYEILLDLSLGRKPRFRRGGGKAKVAASFVLRKFEDAFVKRVPTAAEIAALVRKIPGIAVEVSVEEGRRLSSHFQQDDESYRYALINVSAGNRRELVRKFESVRGALTFRFTK